jgi:transposase
LADEAEAGQNQPAGKSRGGMTTKILALADGLGSLVRLAPVLGQRGEITGAEKPIEGLSLGALLADKTYDAEPFRDMLKSKGIEPVIPARKRRLNPAPRGAEMYKWRHLIENFFQKLKEFKRIAMRACKTGRRFQAMINLAAAVIRTK